MTTAMNDLLHRAQCLQEDDDFSLSLGQEDAEEKRGQVSDEEEDDDVEDEGDINKEHHWEYSLPVARDNKAGIREGMICLSSQEIDLVVEEVERRKKAGVSTERDSEGVVMVKDERLGQASQG